MEISNHQFDQLQFNLRQATDDIERLKARVTALETGAPLPADQSIAPQPQPAETCEAYMTRTSPATFETMMQEKSAQPAETELDITRGMTAGGRRN